MVRKICVEKTTGGIGGGGCSGIAKEKEEFPVAGKRRREAKKA